jgi:molybdate transport system substrate-binding protein
LNKVLEMNETCASNLRVITSGAFAQALKLLVPLYEQKTNSQVDLFFGSSIGAAHDSIPTRLSQGEQFDLYILASSALDQFMTQGLIMEGSRVDLVVSNIGAAVRKTDPDVDISTVEALKHALLSAPRIAYSASASGTYLSEELFQKLGIEEEMAIKAKKIFSERVGTILLRNETDLGFQQVSELKPFEGIKIVGELPPEVQRSFFFSAGIGAQTQQLQKVRKLVEFLASAEVADVVAETGLKPVLPPMPW